MERVNAPERRRVTILFSDIKGFTSLSEQMDPEDVQEIINTLFTIFREIIEKNGGHIDKFIGDAVMAVFGAPSSHEDDPERAIVSALEMQKAMERFNKEESLNLKIRIGINTGEVLWSTIAGEKATAIGDAVNVAERLEEACEPTKVLVSEYTYEQSKDFFTFEEYKKLKVKGRETPIGTFFAISIKSPSTELKVKGEEEIPFIERDTELSELFFLINNSIREKQASFILIEGEAGIGKTRLVSELIKTLDNENIEFTHYTSQCLPFEQSPLLPFLQIIKEHEKRHNLNMQGIADNICQSGIYSKLECNTFSEIIASLILNETKTGGKKIEQERFYAIKALLEAKMGIYDKTLLLVLDDIHWADSATISLLNFLSHNLKSPDVIIIAVKRPAEIELEGFQSLGLDTLSETGVSNLIKNILRIKPKESIPASFFEMLYSRTGGNPYYLEEVLYFLLDRGLIERNPFHLKQEELLIPDTLTGILTEKIDALPANLKKIVKYASVIGKVFWYSVIKGLIGRPVDNELAELEKKGFIKREPESQITNDTEYSFKHELLSSSAYALLTKREREKLHKKIAAMIEDRAKGGAIVYLAAHHYRRGKNYEKANELYKRAGDISFGNAHYNFAIECYDRVQKSPDIALKKARALESLAKYEEAENLLKEMMPDKDRDARLHSQFIIRMASIAEMQSNYTQALSLLNAVTFTEDADIQTDILVKKAHILYRQTKYEEALKLAERGKQIMDRLMPERGEDRDWLSKYAQFINIMANIALFNNEFDSALSYMHRSLELVRNANNKQGIASILNNISLVYYKMGQFEKEEKILKEAISIMKTIGDRQGLAVVLNNLGIALKNAMNFDEALRRYKEALSIMKNLGNRDFVFHILTNIGNIFLYRGEFDRAYEYFEKCLDISKDDDIHTAYTYRNMGMAKMYMESVNSAVDYFTKSLEIYEKNKNIDAQFDMFLNLALAYTNLKEYEKAEKYLNKAEVMANSEIKKAAVISHYACIEFKNANYQKAKTLILKIKKMGVNTADLQIYLKTTAKLALKKLADPDFAKAEIVSYLKANKLINPIDAMELLNMLAAIEPSVVHLDEIKEIHKRISLVYAGNLNNPVYREFKGKYG